MKKAKIMTIEHVYGIEGDEWRYIVRISGREIAATTEHCLRELPQLIANQVAEDFIKEKKAEILANLDMQAIVNLTMAEVAVRIGKA